jgi:hypothetical protein
LGGSREALGPSSRMNENQERSFIRQDHGFAMTKQPKPRKSKNQGVSFFVKGIITID